MSKLRVGRVGEQIKKEISQILQYDLKDPRIGFVTVTAVKVTGDLSQATVYISIMGDEDAIKSSLFALEKAKGYIRSEIGKRIRLRHTPELIFKLDESIAYGSKIEGLLRNLKGEQNHE
ncbi:30S ribosome-binding factor RbfA [Tepidibacillus fermentans]|uniref:Ribosome-binding factor A n=1 Tax=Tepidibacillus fermentans TaxID=1281767 RepID=A0A4R3KHN8_9BACI|nr:30S ribosome-binding factor RbfA [Tepidibacillus fermentans]TCS82985.1 ribosome-binding factor A [Tepidibacillus fermentans]